MSKLVVSSNTSAWRKVIFGGVVAAALACVGSAFAEDPICNKIGADEPVATAHTPLWDSIFATNAWGTGEAEFDPTKVYRLSWGYLNTRWDRTFGGKKLWIYKGSLYPQENTIEFPRDGLELGSGALLRHRVVNTSEGNTVYNGSQIVVNTDGGEGNAVQIGGLKNPGGIANVIFNAPLVGAANQCVKVYKNDNSHLGMVRLRLNGDASRFYGTIWTEGSVSNKIAFGDTVFNGSAQLRDTTSSFESYATNSAFAKEVVATTAAGGNSFVIHKGGTLTMDTLEWRGGTFDYRSTAATKGRPTVPGSLVITNNFTMTADPITIKLRGEGMLYGAPTVDGFTNAVKLVDYSGPNANAMSLDDFRSHFNVEIDETSTGDIPYRAGETQVHFAKRDDHLIIYAQIGRTYDDIIFQTVTDSSGSGGSALAEGVGRLRWSDQQDQHAGGNYFTPKGFQLMVGSAASPTAPLFKGETLTLLSGSKLAHCGGTFTATNMTIQAGTQFVCYGGMGQGFYGNVAFTTVEGKDTFDMTGNKDLYFFDGISGNANIAFYKTEASTEGKNNGGMLVIRGSSKDYTGTITLMSTQATLCVDNGLALGGPLPAVKYDALTLTLGQKLRVTASTTFDEQTRGLYIKMGSLRTTCELDVDAGQTVYFNQPLTLDGWLAQEYEGTLIFGGPNQVRVLGDNVFVMRQGTLRAATTNALDGVRTQFGATAKLQIKADNAATKDYGFYNCRELGYPIETKSTGQTQVNVEIIADDDYDFESGHNNIVPICTVDSAKATAIVPSFFKVTLNHPTKDSFAISVGQRDNGNGTKTVYADIHKPRGLMLFMR